MLDSVLAQTLAKRIMKYLGYNINIMNEKGIIIASGDQKRIGDFHEVAYNVINDGLDFKLVKQDEENYIGVKPGINMPIMNEGEIIGAVGISGNPDEVFKFAYLVRMSVEAMIEHEYYKEQIRKRQNKKNIFCNALLFEEPVNIARLENLAKNLHYDKTLVRVPVIIELFSFKDNDAILEKVKGGVLHTKQDISMTLGNNCIAVFKTVPGNQLNTYRQTMLQYIENINSLLPEPDRCTFFVGTPQARLEDYRQAFSHVTWLEDHIKPAVGAVYFFMDYLLQYFQDMVPFSIFESVFSPYTESIDKYGRDIFIETANALYQSGMNINKASKALFMHRNTILFRLKKMKETIGIDPLHNMSDQQLLFQLLHYVKNMDRIR
ncbi:MAG: CdaR family transcriptional regulator [Bacillota bacterium]